MTEDKLQKLLWSIAIPGFGQFLNGKILKGLVLIFLEFLINVNSNLNEVIILSFNMKIQEAILATNYEWLMFYPCVYMFAMWDAFREAEGPNPPYYYLPFVCGAYFGTIGIIYSRTLIIKGIIFGPVYLGILVFIIGLWIGQLIRLLLLTKRRMEI